MSPADTPWHHDAAEVVAELDTDPGAGLTAAEAACLSTQAVAEAGYFAHRWRTFDEVATTTETVQPDDLAVIVRRAAATTRQAS